MSSYTQIKEISYQGTKVKYTVKYQNQKHIILKVLAGEIKVSAPHYAQDWEIEKLIYKNISKIITIKDHHAISSVYDLNSAKPWIKVLGYKYEIIIDENITRAKIENKKIYIKNYFDHDAQLKKIYSLLAKEFKNFFISRTIDWSTKMNVHFKGVSLKLMKAKWGYCLPQEANISYNTKLLHFEDEIISYVIVHELAHIEFHNHSKDFWKFVEIYSPHYREIQKKLNSIGV